MQVMAKNIFNESASQEIAGKAMWCWRGSGEVIALLRKGADPDRPWRGNSDYDPTPLYWAADNQSETLCRALLNAGADPNNMKRYGGGGFGSFQEAIENLSLDGVRLFIEAGADLEREYLLGLPADHARRKGREDVAQIIETAWAQEREDVARIKQGHIRPGELLEAVQKNNARRVRLLLDNGADVDGYHPGDSLRLTPLAQAAINGNTPLCLMLLEAGADPFLGGRVSDAAAETGHKWLAEVLAEKEQEFIQRRKAQEEELQKRHSAQAKSVCNPQDLDSVVDSGTEDQLRALLDEYFWSGKKPQVQWPHLKTALLRGETEMARLLITWGASAGAKELMALKAENPTAYGACVRILRATGLSPVTLPSADSLPPAPAALAPVLVQGGLFAAPADGIGKDGKRLACSFNAAAEYAQEMNAINYLGYNDWRVPTDKDAAYLAGQITKPGLKGTFCMAGVGRKYADCYWTSTPGSFPMFGRSWNLYAGLSEDTFQKYRLSVRLARGSLKV